VGIYKTWQEWLARDGKTTGERKEINIYAAIRRNYNPVLRRNENEAKGKYPFGSD
jgi:hypothetical protein